jgi:hypothetical protein
MNTFPAPAGAIDVEEWQLDRPRADGSPPNLYRYFTGSSWTIDRGEGQRAITVTVHGLQQLDGLGRRSVVVENLRGYDDRMSIAHARDLKRALTAACDEATEMFERDEVVGIVGPRGDDRMTRLALCAVMALVFAAPPGTAAADPHPCRGHTKSRRREVRWSGVCEHYRRSVRCSRGRAT